MTQKYHITKKGEPGVCHAQGSCPLGGENEHYSSPDDARKAFEKVMENGGKWIQSNSADDQPKETPIAHNARLITALERELPSRKAYVQEHQKNIDDTYREIEERKQETKKYKEDNPDWNKDDWWIRDNQREISSAGGYIRSQKREQALEQERVDQIEQKLSKIS